MPSEAQAMRTIAMDARREIAKSEAIQAIVKKVEAKIGVDAAAGEYETSHCFHDLGIPVRDRKIVCTLFREKGYRVKLSDDNSLMTIDLWLQEAAPR
jgi:hypothetical protein